MIVLFNYIILIFALIIISLTIHFFTIIVVDLNEMELYYVIEFIIDKKYSWIILIINIMKTMLDFYSFYL